MNTEERQIHREIDTKAVRKRGRERKRNRDR